MTTEVPGAQPWDTPGAFSPEPPKQPRQRKAKPEAAPEPAPPKVRKPRVAKAEKAERAPKSMPETVKISIKEYAEMRVTAFQREFVKLHKILAPIPAKARVQMLAELGKVLG